MRDVRVKSDIKTKPFLYIFAIMIVFCAIIGKIVADYNYSARQYETLTEFTGEAYRAPWNGETDFIVRGRAAGGKKITLLVKGKYLSEAESESILKTGKVCGKQLTVCGAQAAGNFYEFDYCNYLKAHNVDYYTFAEDGELKADESVSCVHSLWYFSGRFRTAVYNVLCKYFGESFAAVIMSIMTGDTGMLESKEKLTISAAGFSHLVAVSGAHIAFFTQPFSICLKRSLFGLKKRKLFLLAPVIFLWFAAGGSASVTRAAVMCVIGTVAEVSGRKLSTANALGIAGCMQLLVNPWSIYGSGFILSYGATASICVILPKLKKIINCRNPVIAALLPGIAVNLGILPAVLYLYNSFSPCGMLINVFAAEIAAVICVGGYGIFVLDKIIMALGLSKTTKILSGCAYVFEWLAEKISSGESAFFHIETASPGILFFVIYYTFLACLIFRKSRRVAVPVLCGVILTAVCCRAMKRTEVLFFDVGQGSCALIRTCDGVDGLVDTGTGSTDIAALLKKEGVKRLDFIIISHGHSDHYGGLEEILEEYTPRVVFLPTNGFDTYCNSLVLPGTELVYVSGEAYYNMGKSTVLELYESNNENENLNNGSVIVRISGTWGSVLLPGDAETETMDEMLERGIEMDSEVFCLAHHGSKSSLNEKFLWDVSPKCAIISVGAGNSYGHPSKAVLEAVENTESDVYRTDLNGAVRIVTFSGLFGKGGFFVWPKRRAAT